MKRRKRISSLSLAARLSLLRKGLLDADETAEVVADFGKENFIEAKPDVEALLSHDDPIVRYNAIATLSYEWGTTGKIEDLLHILFHDPDRDCRRQAAGALGSLHRGVKDKRIAKVLGDVVKNERECDDVRKFAYTALLDVLGIERPLQPNPVAMTMKEIDWDLVRNCSIS
jgi:HEAT repeat protein